jgi:hypothetical protein
MSNARNRNMLIWTGLVLAFAAAILGGCGNPFQIGLGDDVDLDTPDVSINTGQLYLSGLETFTGTFTDDFAVAAVDLSFDGGTVFLSATLNQSNHTWSIDVDTAAFPDGEVYVQVRVTDTSGKHITKQALFYIDNRSPLVVVTAPSNITTPEALDSPPYSSIAFSGIYNGVVQVKGEAGDQFGIASVEYQVLDASSAVLQDWTSLGVDGTNSWSFTIDTENDLGVTTTATLQITVRATDRAGNVSSGIMHTDAVVAKNDGDPISVEALVRVVNGTITDPNITITANDIANITVPAIDLEVDQNADIPTFIISNPDEGSPITGNVLSSAPRFTGSVEDDEEGVDEDTIQFMVTRTAGTGTLPSWVGQWTDVTSTSGSELLIRWNADVTGLLDGDYEIQVRASDTGGASGTSAAVAFRVDTGAPAVVVSSPAQGSYQNDTFTISGTASDGQGIASVNVSVDDGANWIPAVVTPAGGEDFDWTVDIDPVAEAMSDGATTIKIEASDGMSTGTFNLQVIIDRTAPSASFTSPANGASVNGTVTVQGTASDNNIVTVVEMSIDGAAFFSLPGLYNWARSIDTTGYAEGDLTVDVRVTDVAGNTYTTSGYSLDVDQSLDLPTVSFVSPTPGQRVAGALPVSGTANDDDGVQFVYMQLDVNDDGDYDDQVNLNGDGDTDDPYEDETDIYLLTGTTTWSTTINSGGELYAAAGGTGAVTIMVWAEDDHVAGDPQERSVQFDAGAPVVTVTSPAQGSYQNDLFTIEGTATDSNGVTDVDVSVNGGASWLPATIAGSTPDFTWDVDIDPIALSLDDGPLTIMIQATDGSSTSDYNLQVIIDTEDPTASFINPAAASSVNGEVTIRGVSSDNTQVTLVELRIGDSDDYFTLTNQYYNWQHTINSGSFSTEPHATETPPGSEIWLLNVTARVTDVAGNQYETSGYYFLIDNDLDKPTVTFVSPSAGQRIGGPVTVTGTALDDDAVDYVEMRLDANGDGDYDDQIDFDGTPGTTGLFEDETVWHTLSGTTLWSQELNDSGELYETEPGHDGTITIQVQAWDIHGTVGNPSELTIVFDDTIPRFENLSHQSSDYEREEFTLTGDVIDDAAVRTIRISYNGGQDYVDLVDDGVVIDTDAVTRNGADDYDLHIDIDTQSTLPGLTDPIDSDILYLRLRVDDYANYQSLAYINLNVDNQYPTGDWDTVNADPDEIETDYALVQGTAEDGGLVSGFGSANVYFIRGGALLNPKGEAPGTLGTGDFDDGSTPLVTDVTSFDYPNSTNDIIIIDDDNEFGDDGGGNGDGDGYDEEITVDFGVYTWWAAFNSTNIPDGQLDIHYVIFDAAGNGTHYEVSGFITNNRPVISTPLAVGTDLDFSGAVDAGAPEQFDYGAAFEARELLYVDVDATDDGTIENCEVRRQSNDLALTPATGSPLTGAEYDITGETEGSTLDLYAWVIDDDDITTRYDFSIIIDNLDDETGPTGTLDPMTDDSVFAGHVEADDEARDFTGSYDPSSYTTQNDTTADVSGTINITGDVWDDQRIDEIELQIDGYDPDGAGTDFTEGAWFTLAAWDDTDDRLEYNELLPAYVGGGDDELASTFNPTTGHNTEFTFKWDTSDIANVVAEDVVIDLRVTDRGATTDTDDVTVDVVPYIAGIDRNDGITQTRTRWGKFTLADGDTNILISGYNLNPDAVYIYNTGGTTSTDISGTINDVDTADYLSFTIDLDGAGTNHSGYLWIEDDPDGGGPLASIVAINNFNDNALEQAMQDDGSGIPGTLWRDDLYIQLWDVDNDFQDSTDAQHPSFAVSSDGTQFAAWSYYNDSQRRYGTDTTSRNTYGGTSYDPTEWNDIAFNHTYDDYFIVNLWNQNVMGTYQSLRLHAFEDPTTMSDDTEVIVIDALDDQLYQYRNPRIAVKDGGANETIIYVSYYDSDAGTTALKFGSFLYDRSGGNNLSAYIANTVVDNTADVGLWSDIGIDDDGVPFIVYYDTTNSTLKIARADDDTTDGTVTWDIADVDSSNSYFGEYVSVAVDDSDGTVHLACYRNASGDLYYYTAPHVATGTDFTFTGTAVDTNGAVGAWSEIAEFGGEPFISYINTSQAGTQEGLKYAYYDGSQWEYGTVPVSVTVQSVRTGIVGNPLGIDWPGPTPAAVPADEDYTVTVSYGSGSYYFARLRPEEP